MMDKDKAVMTDAELSLMRWLDLMGRGYMFNSDAKIYPPRGGAWGHIPIDICRQLVVAGYVQTFDNWGLQWFISDNGKVALQRWEAHKQWLLDIQAD